MSASPAAQPHPPARRALAPPSALELGFASVRPWQLCRAAAGLQAPRPGSHRVLPTSLEGAEPPCPATLHGWLPRVVKRREPGLR